MPQLRVALAQVDVTVGDFAHNADVVLQWAALARERGAHIVAFPEGTLTGYPAEDLVLRQSFVAASQATLEQVARRLAADGLGDLVVVVGYVDRMPGADPHAEPIVGRPMGAPQNTAAVLHRGAIVARYAKHHLPNYGVFDEFRYFVPGDRLPIVRVHGVDLALTICEDLWQDGGPIAVAREAGVGLVLTINGSPYERDKDDTRLALCRKRAREANATLAYVNLVGGQDELVFDGDSIIVDAMGDLIARAPRFEEGLLVTDLDLPRADNDTVGPFPAANYATIYVDRATVTTEPLPAYSPIEPSIAEPMDECPEVYAALVTGTRDYVRKNGFRSVMLGLSGGIDSALVATIATDALGPDAVHTVALPSRFSSEHSIEDAAELARRQGIHFAVLPIADVVDAYEGSLELHGLAAENLQARVRGTTLMALSNEHGHLVLTTGNKSELATGYSTLYGDSAGGFAPIKDVPKTLVWQLARWRNGLAEERGETPPIPENSITKPPSAELRPGQLDTDSLPDYHRLDPLLDDYVEGDLGREALIERGHDIALVDRVIRLVDLAEYKRRQYPPGPKISLRAFGRDRRLPITNCWREGSVDTRLPR
jgi:NAD+ synthase (glutamine-hydrolysing)